MKRVAWFVVLLPVAALDSVLRRDGAPAGQSFRDAWDAAGWRS